MIHNQKGATMIVVLIVLLLIAIAGVIAMRTGIFGSRLATNSQIGGLLTQDSDSLLTKYGNMKAIDVIDSFAMGGLYNYMLNPINANNELVFCYDTNGTKFDLYQAGIIRGGNVSGTGFCNNAVYSSGRSAVITQLHLKRTSAENSTVKEGDGLTGTNLSVSNRINVSVTAVSIMPNSASRQVNPAEINACFQRSAFTAQPGARNPNLTAITACFDGLNIPYEVQSNDLLAGNNITVSNQADAKAP